LRLTIFFGLTSIFLAILPFFIKIKTKYRIISIRTVALFFGLLSIVFLYLAFMDISDDSAGVSSPSQFSNSDSNVAINGNNNITIFNDAGGQIFPSDYSPGTEIGKSNYQATDDLVVQSLRKAEIYFDGKQYGLLVDLYSSGLLAEHPVALNNLGYMYSQGIYFKQNTGSAQKYYELAAQRGLPDANRNLTALLLRNCKTYEQVVDVLKDGLERNVPGVSLFLASCIQETELSPDIMTEENWKQAHRDVEDFFSFAPEKQEEILSSAMISTGEQGLLEDTIPHGNSSIYESLTSIGTHTSYTSSYNLVYIYSYIKTGRRFIYDHFLQESFLYSNPVHD